MISALRSIKTTTGCLLAMLACQSPARGESAVVSIDTTWEIHADLTSNALTERWAHLVFPDGFIDKLPEGSRISILGFNNDATPENDWLVSLRLMKMTDAVWQGLLESFKDQWGAPGDSGRWEIHDADSNLSFVIARGQDHINFTNVAANLELKMNMIAPDLLRDMPLAGKIDLSALPDAALESRLFRSSGLLKFDTTIEDAAMVIDVSVGKIKDFDPVQIEAAIMRSVESRLGEQLSAIIPVPAIERVTENETEWMKMKFTLSAEQSERVMKLVVEKLAAEFPTD